MKTLTRCCVHAAVLAVVLTGRTALPATGQVDVYAAGGSGVYGSDALCLDSGALFSTIRVGAESNDVGVNGAHSNGDWPWAPPPPTDDGEMQALASTVTGISGSAQQETFLSHGNAFQLMAETFPLGLLTRLTGQRDEGALGQVNNYVRPFVGAGVHISSDGDAAPPSDQRPFPTLGRKGATNFIISYGASAFLPSRANRLRLMVQYRGNSMFVNEVEYVTFDGETIRFDGETQSWGEWSIGLSLRVGG